MMMRDTISSSFLSTRETGSFSSQKKEDTTSEMHYFDWTSTTPISSGALKEYVDASLSFYANASSLHNAGIKVAEKLRECREMFASLLKTKSEYVFFTSGGTESNAIILNSLIANASVFSSHGSNGESSADSSSVKEILCTGIEHPAISEYKGILQKFGYKFTTLHCPKGYLDLDKLRKALNPSVKMVCIMAVNNVTGTVQPLSEAIKIIREYSASAGKRIHIHSDAVQAGGKTPFHPEVMDLDSASFSAHKFYGPKGTGLLYCRNKNILSLSKAGGQERGLRGGTENTPGILSMCYALNDALANVSEHSSCVESHRRYLERALLESGFQLLSPASPENPARQEMLFTPYILCVCVPGIPSEVFLRIMNDKGFCLSANSACSASSKAKAESILAAMGFSPRERMSSVRISLSHLNTAEEVAMLADAMISTKKELLR